MNHCIKFFLFTCFLLLSNIALFAQPFRTNSQVFGVGIGAKSSVTMIGGTWELGVGEKVGPGYFGVGAVGALYFTGSNSGRFGNGGTVLALGGQGNYHFDINQPKFDLYTGLNLTAFFAEGSGVEAGLQFGGRYYIQNNLALSLRLSIGGFTTVMFGIDF
jgi:hypothetical protein